LHPFLPLTAALALAAQLAAPANAAPASAAAAGAVAPAPAGAASTSAPAAGAPAPSGAPSEAAKAEPAGPPRLAVVPFDASGDLQLLGRSLAEAVAQEAEKVGGFQVMAPAEVRTKLGDEGAIQASQCGESVTCLVGPGLRLGVDRIVGGFVDRSGASYRFGLVNVDVKAGAAVARATREVPIASRRIRADVVAAAGPLLRGEAAGTGVLAILTEAPGAEVRVDDRPAGRTPLEAKLPAGKHKVEVSQRGKVRVEPFWVDVPAGGRAEQKVRLFDIPVAERRPGEIETTVEKVKVGGRKR
jgi:hypothetical protein